MTDVNTSDVFLVGSVPVADDSVEQVFRLCGGALGDRLFALPDGEVGPRRFWIQALETTTWPHHPDLERSDVSGPFGKTYQFKPGVTSLSLEGYVPYADAALDSYAIFRGLRDSGELPADVRFQVSIPTPHAAVGPYFADAETMWPLMQSAYRQAISADIARMLETIPGDDLAIQWDICTEVCDVIGAASGNREVNGVWPWNPTTSAESKLEQHTSHDYLPALSDQIPEQVLCGYHLCLGTWPEFPVTPLDDLTLVVRMANALVANTSRRVDFVHLPITRDAGRDYCAPLAGLEIGGAKPILGVEAKDGLDAMLDRARAAREFLPTFGISHYCGYGRDSEDEMETLLGDLRVGAQQLRDEEG